MGRTCILLTCLCVVACRASRPSELPRDEAWVVAVSSCRLPEYMQWYTRFAHHTWIDAKRGDEDAWVRVEVMGKTTGGTLKRVSADAVRADRRWGREVALHDVCTGERARSIALQLDAAVDALGPAYATGYRAWPGPNSNTFVRDAAREAGGFGVTFDHNALGKDDYGWFGLGLASSRSGVHVDTRGLGATLAAREGVELHVLGLTFGLQVWPPRLELPLLPELPWSQAPHESTAVIIR